MLTMQIHSMQQSAGALNFVALLLSGNLELNPGPVSPICPSSQLCDGHFRFLSVCLLLSHQLGIKMPSQQIIIAVHTELNENIHDYGIFDFNSSVDDHEQITNYLTNKCSNAIIGGAAPLAVAIALALNFNILDSVTTRIHRHALFSHWTMLPSTGTVSIFLRYIYYSSTKTLHKGATAQQPSVMLRAGKIATTPRFLMAPLSALLLVVLTMKLHSWWSLLHCAHQRCHPRCHTCTILPVSFTAIPSTTSRSLMYDAPYCTVPISSVFYCITVTSDAPCRTTFISGAIDGIVLSSVALISIVHSITLISSELSGANIIVLTCCESYPLRPSVIPSMITSYSSTRKSAIFHLVQQWLSSSRIWSAVL